ncbi:Uncharacterized protein APZ42_012288 [Daphnia magna]|uniref:Uncharacterized protein n=1 Tax=Daphnia magna TaxID=35525 RepID=A0A162RZ51_9CRUS|nr:Uncharacterized protein APZ42_012288 [Daphnia magna]
MASAAVIGMPFDTVTNDFQLTFVTAAMAYSKRFYDDNHLEIKNHSLKEEFGIPNDDADILQETNDSDNEDPNNSSSTFCNPDAIFEPFENEHQKEGETWGPHEGYCSSPIYTGLTGKIACPQHIHNANRGESFFEYSLFEYAGLVKVVAKSHSQLAKPTLQSDAETLQSPHSVDFDLTMHEEKIRHQGRKSNGTFSFDARHPLFDSHDQQIRSKHVIPIVIGVPPCPPGKRNNTMTDALIYQARKFPEYILTLFRPWKDDNGRLSGQLTWKALCEFLDQLSNNLHGKEPSMLSRIRMAWIGNVSRGLRMNSIKRVAATHYRMRNATVLGKPDGTSAIVQTTTQDAQGCNFEIDTAVMDGDYSKDRRFQQNDARTAIDILRMEAAADDLIQRKNQKELAFHQVTLNLLRLIMGRDAAATIQSPLSETTVRRLLYTTAPENTSFEKIITQLSSPMPSVQQIDNAHTSSQQNGATTDSQHKPKDDPKDTTINSMNDGQKKVYRTIDDYLHAEAASRKANSCKPEPSQR